MTEITHAELTAFISKLWWEGATVPSIAAALLEQFKVTLRTSSPSPLHEKREPAENR